MPAGAATPNVSVVKILLLHNRVLLAVTVNGSRPLRFALDTGDSDRASIDPEVAASLGLKIAGGSMSSGIVGQEVHATYSVQDIVIGGVLRQPAAQLDGVAMGDVEGLLPAHLLQTQDADLDFTKGELRLYFSGEADHAGYTAIPYDKGHSEHQVIAPCRLDDQALRLQLDTGDPDGITLLSNYVRDRGLWNAFPTFLEEVVRGTAGATRSRTVRMKSFQIGATRFRDPIVTLIDPQHFTADAPESDGLVGLDVLRRFDMSFQTFPRTVLWIKRNDAAADAFRVDRSGLDVRRTKNGVCTVSEVAPGSAAEAAGLKVGDVLPTINTSGLVSGLYWLLSDAAGTEVALEVERGGVKQTIKLVLADRV